MSGWSGPSDASTSVAATRLPRRVRALPGRLVACADVTRATLARARGAFRARVRHTLRVLPTPARLVADALLDEESLRRRHVVVALGGAHAAGFAAPGEAVALRALHVAPTASLLGLRAPALAIERTEVRASVHLHYASNEIGPAVVGLVLGNGAYAERVLAAKLRGSPELETLAPIALRALSRRYHRHYRGAALSHLRAFDHAPTPGRALRVLGAALTGAHLLAAHAVVVDLDRLLDAHGFGGARALVATVRAGDEAPLAGTARDRWRAELQRATTLLDDAERTSTLPALTANEAELDAWLVALRRAML